MKILLENMSPLILKHDLKQSYEPCSFGEMEYLLPNCIHRFILHDLFNTYLKRDFRI